MQKENLEKILEIKRELDQLLADKEEQVGVLQAQITTLRKINEQVSSLLSGVSFVTAADILNDNMPRENIIASPATKEEINEIEILEAPEEESSAQWEKYINDAAGNLVAKLVYYAGTATIVITHPEELKLQKTSPLFQEFFIQEFLVHLKEQAPGLTLDFEETATGFLRQVTLSRVDSDENFAKIERAIEHVLDRKSVV